MHFTKTFICCICPRVLKNTAFNQDKDVASKIDNKRVIRHSLRLLSSSCMVKSTRSLINNNSASSVTCAIKFNSKCVKKGTKATNKKPLQRRSKPKKTNQSL